MTTSTTVTGTELCLKSFLDRNSILGFAIKNYRDRFLIPSDRNLFGGIIIEYVFVDSGSNSSLFPLPITKEKMFDIEQLISKFPFNNYVWSIGTAHGVGLIPNTTLHIKPISNDNNSSMSQIKCVLHFDVKPLEFHLPYIRFSLNKESIEVLVQRNELPLSEADKEVLKHTLNFFNEFEDKFSAMINKNKRDYCLLGQHFLRNFCSVQLNDTIIFVDKQQLREKVFPHTDSNISEMMDFLYYQRPTFSKTERFLNCEDNEHGGHDLFNISDQQIDIDESSEGDP